MKNAQVRSRIVELVRNVEIGGKLYLKTDVEAALKTIKPVK